MKKAIKMLFITLSILIGSYILIIGIMWWNSSDPREEQSYRRSQYKSIWFENRLDSTYFFIKINLEYTVEDSLSYTESKMDSIVPFSILDSIMLNYYPSNKTDLMMPILSNDSAKFPKSFYIKIYNEDKSELLKELNYNSFMQHAILEYVANETNPLTAQQWTLVVDSTLLNLKEYLPQEYEDRGDYNIYKP